MSHDSNFLVHFIFFRVLIKLVCNGPKILLESPGQGAPQRSLGDSIGAPKMFSAERPVTASLVSLAKMTAPL